MTMPRSMRSVSREAAGVAGEAEVEHAHAAARGDEDVGRLDVAVDDSRAMRCLQRIGNLDGQLEQRVQRQRSRADPLLQRRPLEILHHDERPPVLLADVVDRADIRVIQRGGRPRFAREPGQRCWILRELRRDELERHRAVQPRVFGLVDDAHAAAGQPGDDVVVRERLVDQRIAAGLMVAVAALAGELACGEINRRSREEALGMVVCGEQRPDLVLQPLVATTGVAKIGVALERGHVERGLQQLIDVTPAVTAHWRPAPRALDTTRLLRSSTPASR